MAIELISTIKPKNNGEFPIAEANDIKGGYYSVASIEERDKIPRGRRQPGMLCYVLGDKIYKLNDDLNTWNELKTGGGGEVVESNNIWIGTQPPTEEGYKLWIDISDEVLDETFSSAVINEFKNIISSLTNRVVQLEKEVEYLKANGGGTTPDNPPTPDKPSTTNDTLMTFEDGSLLTFEDGSIMCFDIDKSTSTSDTILVDENLNTLTFEDEAIMCFEKTN